MKYFNKTFGKTGQIDNEKQTVQILNLVSDILRQSGIRQIDRDDSSGIISFAIGSRAAASIRADLSGKCLKLFCHPGMSTLLPYDLTDTEKMIDQKQYTILNQNNRLSSLLIPSPKGKSRRIIYGELPLKRNLDRNLIHCFYEMNRLLLEQNQC